jgi:hypothetical protein
VAHKYKTSFGTDVITVQVCDSGTPGTSCTNQTPTITVTPVNDTQLHDDTVALALTEDGANGTVNTN